MAARGAVPVRLLVDRDTFSSEDSPQVRELTESGVKPLASWPKPAMHWQMAVIDGHWVWTGSANVSSGADSAEVDLQTDSLRRGVQGGRWESSSPEIGFDTG